MEFGQLLWPHVLASCPARADHQVPFWKHLSWHLSSFRKPSRASVAFHGLSPLNLCPVCVALRDSECGPVSLSLSLSGPIISLGQGVEAEAADAGEVVE